MSDGQYEGVAIIGVAGRFPGADTVEEFWANLVAAKESISFFSDEELAASGLDIEDLKRCGHYVPARGVLRDADCFDAAFFGVHPKEAEVLDPQQRVFLETCWAALERAGYAPTRLSGSVGVFAGATYNTYYLHALHRRSDLIELIGSDLVMFGNERDYLTTRVAYKLGLTGPALNVSTACSSSLVAVCQACESLLTHQCDMALAGGVSVRVPQASGYYYDDGNIGSPDGKTRTFDEQAAGTVFSNGVGVVVLKRLEDAVKDGDRIYAVIKGAAVNNDGAKRVSFGAPGVEGQAEVIAMAHALAGVDPETITLVEAHGTATPLGDPIEVAGLTRAFRLGTDAKQFCALGSVKTNVGHLDAASGVTGLIKTALSISNGVIPASLHFSKPNPKLDLENSPFYVNAALRQWNTPPDVPRRAGVSSFGTGGTNAHVVVEQAPDLEPSGPSRPFQLMVLSAKTPEALDRATQNLAAHLRYVSESNSAGDARRELADAAFTLQTGRSEFTHRRIVVCRDAADGAVALETRDSKRIADHLQKLREPSVVFMFPGQGAQYAGMGRELYRSEPVFRSEVDRCAELLGPLLETDLRSVMFADEDPEQVLSRTRFTQPALFTIEYALAKLWMSWGIQPAAMIGHSVGEYVAACLSGVFSLEDAIGLVARRGALVQSLPGGAMLAIRLPEHEVAPLLDSDSAIAAINSPNLCVAAGPHDSMAALKDRLEARGVMARLLRTSHAFHSPMMEPAIEPFTELLRGVPFHEPRIPFVSNVTARWITPEEVSSPDYWAGHVRDTVRFSDGIGQFLTDANNVLLEVGPGQTLSVLARQHPAKSAEQTVASSLHFSGEDELRGVLETLGRLWMTGASVDWRAFYAHERRHRVVLPTYPFERRRCWPEPIAASIPEPSPAARPVAPHIPAQPGQGREAVPAQIDSAPAEPRIQRLLSAVRTLVQELSGADLTGVDTSAGLLELGLDSLLLTQASQLFQRRFGVPISFRQLMEELSSLDDIAHYLDAALPPEAFAPAPAAQPAAQPVATDAAISPAPAILEQLLAQQQQLTSQLLQLLGRQPAAQPSAPPVPTAPLVPAPPTSENKAHGPFKPIQRGADMVLSPPQSAALDALIARYTKRTAGSKKLAAQNRPILADPRSVAGFKQLWKEMVYPIATTRSDGARVWDVDGNEYIDFVMGFGASLFGHRPPFVIEAIGEQLGKGFEIGPIQPLAGEVAALLTEFTGMPRVGFTNTGSEAVLAATRVARTVTGRDKIAVFAGAYHGIFDEVLFRPLTINGETRTAPIAPGIPSSALDQVIVLDYGNPESLDILRRRGSEIAAVLVEPVQSRRLDLQPREFLRELRRVTLETGAALVFDEVVTGFRVHPGGAQALFGIRADLATYGKVIGGGLPVGVIAGDPKFMDALDGGQWQYGDTSFPEVGVTFFAGTFVRHPLALAAARAVLTHLRQQGPALQNHLAERTARVADQLRAVIEEFAAPYQVAQFSSLIQVGFPADRRFAALLHYMLRDRGIHIYENRAFVMTTAHTDDDLARLVAAFRESLLEMQSGGFLTGHAPAAKIAVASIPAAALASADDPFPLTEPQKEIWLAAQMGPDAAVAYNESLTLDFRGPFDVDLFRTALREVVLRHPILLATFSPNGEWQQIKSREVPDAPLLALDALSELDRDRELKQIVEGEVAHFFDLTSGPLLRVKIVRLSADRHAVVWTAHHIVCDGWSGGLLVNELAAVYSALRRNVRPELPPPATFAGYARGARVDDAASREAVDYWRSRFSQLPDPLDLPLDRPRPAVRSAQAATRKRTLDSAIQQSVRRLASQQKTTVVVLLMAALKTLIHRLTGQTDLVIGLGVAGQASLENGCLVGHCVNLLPVRTQLNPEASFQDHLASVRKNVLDACDHNQSTLGAILQHISAPRTPNRPPLVEIIFNVDRDPGAAQFDGVEFACDRNPKRALHFDLFFNFVDGPRGLYVECDFNTDLFEPATIERWLGHYETLLQGVLADPSQPLYRLPVLSEADRRALTTERCGGAVVYPATRTLHEWFERQVEKTPRARAVTFENEHLTYRELNERANRLAHYLRKLGVAPDALVALYLERSIDLVVGILGILKSGAAYLPIDPVYPKDRVSFMLEDSQAAVLLTRSDLASNLPGHQAKIVCLDSRTDLFDCEPDANPAPVATPDNLAYVIYTSGSTGKPKGALITHHNVARLMQSTEALYRFNEHDVWTLFHSHAFDFSVWELWGALLYGGRVVVVPYLTSRSPRDFHELLRNERVTVLNQTPSAFRQFIQAEAEQPSADGLALRYVIFGGEALEMNTLRPWFDRHGDRQPLLVNMYGITETTVHVTARVLSAADLNAGSVIGAPLEDLRLYILDPSQQPVPIGVAGEICVGGDGVGRGYLNRPDLTEQKFLLDRFSGKPGALLYRSGDLARFLPNGDIEYLGRIDDQVKIRGFRIERGEIEAVLSRHESVRQCFVDVREETPGEKTLVAWFVPRQGSTPSIADLRVHLRQALPDYMVPSAFVSMERLPLTSNGKIDRKALPLPGERTIDPDHRFVAPRDPVEQVLARIWSKVLKVNRVGLRDNFFDLGGHSLLAVRIIVEIEKVYGKRLPLATLLRAPTIGDLADVLRRESWRPSWSSLVPIRPGGSRTPLFLFHSHGGNVLEYHSLASRLDADQPVYALQACGLDGNIPKGRTLEAMAADYLTEVKTLQPAGPYVLGGFCFGGLLAIEAARQLRAAGDEVALVVVIQTVHPAAARFRPDTTWLRRSWYRAAKRFDLERENLLYRGRGYFRERGRRLVDIAVARTQIAVHGLNGNGQAHADGRSTPYILESLAIEHDRIFDKYRPRPYSGAVLLFRAEKQLRGLVAGPALGWNGVIDGHLDVCEIPGHQQNILLEPNVSRLAGELEARLRELQIARTHSERTLSASSV